MSRLHRILNGIVWGIIGILGIYILGYGVKGQSFAKAAYACVRVLRNGEGSLTRAAERALYPGFSFLAGDRELSYSLEEFVLRKAVGIFPMYSFWMRKRFMRRRLRVRQPMTFWWRAESTMKMRLPVIVKQII